MLTRHAEIRCAQRGIKNEVIDIIVSYGECRYRKGSAVYFLDKAAKQRAVASLDAGSRKIADRLNSYVVMTDEGRVITVAKRHKKLKW